MNYKIRKGITFDDVLLVPKKSAIKSRALVSLETQLTPKIKLKIPVISSNMDTVTEHKMAISLAQLGGIGIIHRFLTIDEQVNEIKLVKKHKLLVGGAIGIGDDYLDRTGHLLKAGADVIVLDIAHGHSTELLRKLQKLTRTFPEAEFIAGNIATAQGAQDLIEAGAASLKVGVGPGAMCSTRVVAGAGVPQITAVMDVASVAHKHNIPIISDGGIRTSGDIAKALAAGASTVMLGTLLAACSESPALLIKEGELEYKINRGMASLAANRDRAQRDKSFKKDLEACCRRRGGKGSFSRQG